jgi:hypothetical protein
MDCKCGSSSKAEAQSPEFKLKYHEKKKKKFKIHDVSMVQVDKISAIFCNPKDLNP